MGEATQDVAQSRVGKRPLSLPEGVQLKVDGRNVTVKGPKGELSRTMPTSVSVNVDGKTVTVVPDAGAGRRGKQFQGLARALLASMVEGTANGFNVSLDLKGVGYRAELKGQELTMSLGLSHQVKYPLSDAIKAKVEIIDEGGIKTPRVHLTSHDKEALGQAAARIRSFRPPEPYKGKGVRYTGERIREKAGKAGGKK
ncbi:MAG: 50S ribosomal protein L6 [Myxococcales bacterium]|nr:50S ribosomal protein L6 [Myxococcales bacterium]MDD9966086.1 50S ribosomal protein L6 [Myxococcales bacterium]